MHKLTLIALVLLILSGCGPERPAGTVPPAETDVEHPDTTSTIAGVWILDRVNDTLFDMTEVYGFTSPQPQLQLSPASNKIGGHSGCNGFGGTAYFEADKIVVPEPVVATQMGCGGNVWENDFFDRLMQIKTYTLNGDTLQIYGNDGNSMLFLRKKLHPLEMNYWELTRVNDTLFDIKKVYQSPNEPQPTIRFDLEKKQLGGWNGCNAFGLDIELKDTYYTSGELFSDARGCYPGWSEKFHRILKDNKKYSIKNDVLLLESRGGETLEFRKVE